MKRIAFLPVVGIVLALLVVGVSKAQAAPPPPPGKHPLPAKTKKFKAPRHDAALEEQDERGESAPNTYSTDYMLYRGGPVQTSPRIYLIFWGDWTSTGDPYDVRSRLYSFLAGVGGSSFNQTQTQYAQGCYRNSYSCPSTAAFIQNTTNQLRNAWWDYSYVPSTPTQTDVRNEALRAAARFGDYGINTQYFVALPRGHGDNSFVAKGGSTCAYHSWTLAGATTIQYTTLPYMPDAGSRCGNYSVNNSILDGVTIIASHEYAETETDPWVAAGDGNEGWDDSTRNAGENGDKCAGPAGYNHNMSFSTGTFPIQSEWSNYHRYYFGYGCVFAM